jgi:hypothetical protein
MRPFNIRVIALAFCVFLAVGAEYGMAARITTSSPKSTTKLPAEKTGLFANVNYPGLGVGFLYKNYAFELRAQALEHTKMTSLRASQFFQTGKTGRYVYLGVEAGGFQYDDDTYTSEGTILGGFLGLEYFFTRHFSFTVDMGPYYASATKDQISESVFDVVGNTSINFYFKGLRHE